MRGDGPRPSDEAELQRMQDAHIGNFEARYVEGRLVTAGPLADPTGERRGIVVLSVETREEVTACFESDPYVQNGIMLVDARRWETPPQGFAVPPDPSRMAEFRIVRIEGMNDTSFPSLPNAVGGRFAGENGGVLLLPSNDDDAIRSALDASVAAAPTT